LFVDIFSYQLSVMQSGARCVTVPQQEIDVATAQSDGLTFVVII